MFRVKHKLISSISRGVPWHRIGRPGYRPPSFVGEVLKFQDLEMDFNVVNPRRSEGYSSRLTGSSDSTEIPNQLDSTETTLETTDSVRSMVQCSARVISTYVGAYLPV